MPIVADEERTNEVNGRAEDQ